MQKAQLNRMRIENIVLSNFKRFEQIKIDLCPGINLFVGTNGSGKSAVVEACGVILGGFFNLQKVLENKWPIRKSEVRLSEDGVMHNDTTVAASVFFENALIQISRTFNVETENNDHKAIKPLALYGENVFNSFSEPNDRSIAPLICYYSTDRLFSDTSITTNLDYDKRRGRRNGYQLCLSGFYVKGIISRWLAPAVTDRATRQINEINEIDIVLENVTTSIEFALQRLLENSENLNVRVWQSSSDNYDVFVKIGEEKGLPLSYYSDGYRSFLYLIIDLVRRASTLNPWLNFEQLKEQTTGVVLIDEIDLHLHPKWQGKILKILTLLFPNVQFVITSHSPKVISNFESRFSEVTKDRIDGIFILDDGNCELLDNNTYGQDVNTVLSNIMGAENRPKAVLDKIKHFKVVAGSPSSTLEELRSLVEIVNYLRSILPGTDPEMIKINALWNKIESNEIYQ